MDLNRFSIVNKRQSYQIPELALHNKHLIILRWFYASILTAVAVASAYISDIPEGRALLYLYIGLVVLVLNGILQLLNNRLDTRHDTLRLITIAQVALDVILISYIVYVLGGIEARSTALFAIPILTAGLLFSAKVVYTVAILCGVGYVGSILVYELVNTGSFALPPFLVPVIFYPAVFLVLAYLLNYLLSIKVKYTREQAYDSFLNMLSHSLKHPASTAAAILDVLEDDNASQDQKTKHYLEMLKKENNDLIRLLDNLLEAASEISTSQQNLDLAKLIREVAKQQAKAHHRLDDLSLDFSREKLTFKADSGKLRMALTNVIGNAFKYSPTGTPVVVELATEDEAVRITITDAGEGVPKDIKKRMFDKYSISDSLDYASQGLGLGLFVASKIIAQHRGELELKSSPKQGTKVIISFNGKD